MLTCHPITEPIRSAVPTFEPVTVIQAKRQCSLAQGVDRDEEMKELIRTAREKLEHDAMRVCATGAFTWKMTEWASGNYFELPRTLRPVLSITSIAYTAADGTSPAWSASEYALDTHIGGHIIRLNYGYSWPALRGDINGITITAVAGYASQFAVPEQLKRAVLAYIGYLWYEGTDEAQRRLACYENLVTDLRPEVYG